MKAQLLADQFIFEFKGLWDIPSKCGLRIIEYKNKTIVVTTELYKENPGTSIAQVSTSLATQICKTYNVDFHNLVYIEHNPEMHSKLSFYDQELFIVHFEIINNQLSNPKWERLAPNQMAALLLSSTSTMP